MSEYYTLSDNRLAEIADAARLPEEFVREIALADWQEGAAHQQWLDTAPILDIADWVAEIAADLSEEEAR